MSIHKYLFTTKQYIKKKIPIKSQFSEKLRNSTESKYVGSPGPLVDVYNKLRLIPGWFNLDDCIHFNLILQMQSAHGMKGDIFEIGSFYGRSTALMATCLKEDEKIFVCDAFQGDTDDRYSNKPTPDYLLSNVMNVNPGLSSDKLVIFACLSNDLQMESNLRFRFIHIDGGHSREQVKFDLALCKEHIQPKGIIAVDDYDHRDWLGVLKGVNEFLDENKDMEIFADLNRHGAIGRKIYLAKK